MTNNIVIVGAGVSGLTCALFLSRTKANNVTVVAKHMPGDYDIEYASPWAGANVLPMAPEATSRWERRSWPELARLAADVPEAGIHFLSKRRITESQVLRREVDVKGGMSAFDALFAEKPWFQTMFDEFRELGKDELRGYYSGCEFKSVCINTAIYLPWLLGQCRKQGVVFKRGILSHIHEAKTLHHTGQDATIVVNTTGLASLKLGGVEDKEMAPARGQIVVVRNETDTMKTVSGTDDGPTEVTYIMTRAAGGGTVIGGTYDKGNWDPNPDPNIAVRIMKRAVELSPELAGGKGITGLNVIRHGVGLRPYRASGVRIETDRTTFEDGTPIVHNYGHAGWGYQGSYGCAERVVELVNEIRTANGESLEGEQKLFSWDS